jgi:hypothetical protein
MPANPRPEVKGMTSSGDKLETQRRSLEAEFLSVLGRYPDISMNSPPPEWKIAVERRANDREPVQVFQTQDSASLFLSNSNSPSNFPYRLGLATCLLLLGSATSFFLSLARVRDLFASSPAFVLALTAVVCLLLLPFPLLFALVPAVAAAWFSLRRIWPSAKVDTPSHLIRSRRPHL